MKIASMTGGARRPVTPLLTVVTVIAAVVAIVSVDPTPVPASATSAPTPLLWLDASNPASYPGTGSTWADISGNNNHGTIVTNSAKPGYRGGITFDATRSAFVFPGASGTSGTDNNGVAYVALGGTMQNFTNGITVEFEGEFGAVRSVWERIFDFAEGIDQITNDVWVGQFENTNELAIEVWDPNETNPSKVGSWGYCHTATNGTALGSPGDRTLNKWLITIANDAGRTCSIYRNGIALPTRVARDFALRSLDPAGADLTGSAYSALPTNVARTSNFLGRSNFGGDPDFEGSIRYIRIYDQALTAAQALANATATVTFHANGGSGSMVPQSSTTSAPLTPNTFTRPGFAFTGWNTTTSGSAVAYVDGDTYPFASDVTLYAQWVSVPLPPPPPPSLPNPEPVGGTTTAPHALSAAASNTSFEPGTPVVFLAAQHDFADALTIAPSAGIAGGPLLLVDRDHVPAEVVTEIARLQPSKIVIVGGVQAIGSEVATFARTLAPSVERIGGRDRYETAALISRRDHLPGVDVVYIARGDDHADAVAAGPAAGLDGAPVLLVRRSEVPAVTAAELTRLAPARIIVVGGVDAVPPSVIAALGAFSPAVDRIGGADRYETSVLLTRDHPAGGGVVYLADGTGFAGALSAVPAAVNDDAVVMLVRTECIPDVVIAELWRRLPRRVMHLGAPTRAAGADAYVRCAD